MEAVLEIPKRKHIEIVTTGQMRRAASRILAIHGGGGLGVLHGRSRLGKTTTANWITGGINDQYNTDDPDTFRAAHYEVGEITKWSGQEMKKGIRSLYHAIIGRLDEGQYRQLPPEDLARQLVYGLRRKNIGLIFVDEAGCLSVDAIRGMVLVSDVAHLSDWALTIVFVGMDDLPTKICSLPQLEKRVHEWLYFQPYEIDETWTLLKELHPHFKSLDGTKTAHREQVEYIHETYGGVPGEIVPFIRRLSSRLDEYNSTVDITMLKAIHLATQRDKSRAIEDSTLKYQGQLPDGEVKSVSAGKGGKNK